MVVSFGMVQLGWKLYSLEWVFGGDLALCQLLAGVSCGMAFASPKAWLCADLVLWCVQKWDCGRCTTVVKC